MPSKKGLVDLRGKRTGSKPLAGQRSLFGSGGGRDASRRMPLKARRRRVRAVKAFAMLLIIGGLVWGVHYASYRPEFTIQRISVSGTTNVPASLIEEYAWTVLDDGSYHFIARRNVLVYPAAVIARDIAVDFPRIRKAEVSRPSLFSTDMNIKVEERQPYARWCGVIAGFSGDEQCYEMDEGGFLFAEATASSTMQTAYVFRGGLSESASSTPAAGTRIGWSFVPAHLPGLSTLLRFLGQGGFVASDVHVEDDTDFTVSLAPVGGSGTFLLKASFGQDANALVHNLQLVLASDPLATRHADIEYIDLRFGSKVYYKFRGEAEAGTE